MSFLDEVKAEGQNVGPKCAVLVWLETQKDVTDQDIREGARAASAAAVWRVMKARGYVGSRQPVERHVRQECKCPTS